MSLPKKDILRNIIRELIKKEIDRLIVVHDYVFSRSKVSQDAVTPSHAISLPPVRHKLVREITAI